MTDFVGEWGPHRSKTFDVEEEAELTNAAEDAFLGSIEARQTPAKEPTEWFVQSTTSFHCDVCDSSSLPQ